MAGPDDILQPIEGNWNLLMEALVVGAIRGMAESHLVLNERAGNVLPPVNDLTMFEAAEVLLATLLEDSTECEHERDFPQALRRVGRDVRTYLTELRRQREETGEATLHKILAQAGLERHRAH